MQLINKVTFRVIEIEDYRVTEYSCLEWAILSTTYDVTDTRFVKELTYGILQEIHDTVIEIVMKSASEIQAIKDEDAKEAKRQAIIKKYTAPDNTEWAILVIVNLMYLKATYPDIFNIGLVENNPRIVNYTAEGMPIVTTYFNRLQEPYATIVKNDSNFTITYKQDELDNV